MKGELSAEMRRFRRTQRKISEGQKRRYVLKKILTPLYQMEEAAA